jgi:hypothetical protein
MGWDDFTAPLPRPTASGLGALSGAECEVERQTREGGGGRGEEEERGVKRALGCWRAGIR